MAFLYFFTFLAGIVTVLSPCVLPVLPAILSAGLGKGRYRPLGVIIGLVLSFAFFTLSLTFLVHLLGI
jgi:cytochrome c-type biogenesis protein